MAGSAFDGIVFAGLLGALFISLLLNVGQAGLLLVMSKGEKGERRLRENLPRLGIRKKEKRKPVVVTEEKAWVLEQEEKGGRLV